MNIKKTANLLLNFAIKRLAEIFGIIIFISGTFLLISLITYSPEDPNFIFPKNTEIKNLLGFQGSFVSDLFFQSVGLISYLISFTFIIHFPINNLCSVRFGIIFFQFIKSN